MSKPQSRRKLSNIIVDPKALLRFSFPFLSLIIISVATIMALHWQILATLGNLESLTNYSPASAVTVNEAITRITLMGMGGMFVLGIVCLTLWIIYSHRIFGPTVPIRRHINKLITGDFQTRIHLRKNDEFKEIANDLNLLAEKLGGPQA